MKPSTPAVACRDLRKHFGEGDTRIEVLRGVGLEAAAGELTFLLGPSGCGKTTLISVIAGLLDSSSGSVEIFGENTERLAPADRVRFRRANLGFVFQQYNLLPSLSATENAAVPLLAAGVRHREAFARARELLHRLGIGDRMDTPPSQLSGGQQQRVALARALIHGPRLLVCDEPTAAMDHKTGEVVMELLAGAALAPDRGVIVVTHDTRMLHFAHTIARMDDGRIVDLQRGTGT